MIATTDVLATLAEVVGVPLPAGAGEDSFSFAGALRDPEHAPPREAGFVMHSVTGAFAIRQGRFKLLLAPGSGGWSDPKPGSPEEKGLPPTQLYDLEADPKESTNLVGAQPEIAARLDRLLASFRDAGRSALPPQPARPPAAGARSRPNILVILSDDQGLTPSARGAIRMSGRPSLDWIAAAAGASFTYVYIMGGNQGAVCAPSRAMMLSDQSLFKVNSQLKDTVTWPILIRQRRDTPTSMTGKWHNGPASRPLSFPNRTGLLRWHVVPTMQCKLSAFDSEGKPR